MVSAPLLYETRERVAYLRLNRPSVMNAIDESMMESLGARVAEVAADEGVKALVISGQGDAFCVGLDLGLLERAFADTSYFKSVL